MAHPSCGNVRLRGVPINRDAGDWQYDFWYLIVSAAINGKPDRPKFSGLPGFEKPAASRYAATTPHLLRWFNSFNSGRDYPTQVHPFNFLTVFPARRISADWLDLIEAPGLKNSKRRDHGNLPRPVAPFNSDPKSAGANCFDRLTGDPVPINRLKTYSE